MADSKVSNLTENTTPTVDDLLYQVDDPAGSPLSKKVTIANIDTLLSATTKTLTNKTLTSPTINSPTGIVKGDVGLGNVDNTADTSKTVASSNALESATTTVSVSGATAPTTGQVLTAVSTTVATWQTPAGGGGLTWGDSITGGTVSDGITLTLENSSVSAQRALKITTTATQSSTLTYVEFDGTVNASSTNILQKMNTNRGICLRLLDNAGQVISSSVGIQIDPNINFNNNSTLASSKLKIGNSDNASTGINSAIIVDNAYTTVPSISSSVQGAGLGINQSGADGTAVIIFGNNNVNASTNGLVNYTLSNTQSGASIMQKVDMGTSAQGHTGLLLNAFGASTSQRGVKVDMGSTGTGTALELVYSGNGATSILAKLDVGSGTFSATAMRIYQGGATIVARIGENINSDSASRFIHFDNKSYSGALSNRSTDYLRFITGRTNTATSGTITDNFDYALIRRLSTQNGTGGTLVAGGSVLKLQNTSTQSNGTLTDTVSVLELSQDNDSTGGHILMNTYTGVPLVDGTFYFDGSDLKARIGGTTYTFTKS